MARIPRLNEGAKALIAVGLIGGAGLFTASNVLYNVEGGHRAIVFNRFVGVKNKVEVLFQVNIVATLML